MVPATVAERLISDDGSEAVWEVEQDGRTHTYVEEYETDLPDPSEPVEESGLARELAERDNA